MNLYTIGPLGGTKSLIEWGKDRGTHIINNNTQFGGGVKELQKHKLIAEGRICVNLKKGVLKGGEV